MVPLLEASSAKDPERPNPTISSPKASPVTFSSCSKCWTTRSPFYLRYITDFWVRTLAYLAEVLQTYHSPVGRTLPETVHDPLGGDGVMINFARLRTS